MALREDKGTNSSPSLLGLFDPHLPLHIPLIAVFMTAPSSFSPLPSLRSHCVALARQQFEASCSLQPTNTVSRTYSEQDTPRLHSYRGKASAPASVMNN